MITFTRGLLTTCLYLWYGFFNLFHLMNVTIMYLSKNKKKQSLILRETRFSTHLWGKVRGWGGVLLPSCVLQSPDVCRQAWRWKVMGVLLPANSWRLSLLQLVKYLYLGFAEFPVGFIQMEVFSLSILALSLDSFELAMELLCVCLHPPFSVWCRMGALLCYYDQPTCLPPPPPPAHDFCIKLSPTSFNTGHGPGSWGSGLGKLAPFPAHLEKHDFIALSLKTLGSNWFCGQSSFFP